MPDAMPVARSPIVPAPPEVVLAGWVVSGRRSPAELTLTDLTPLTKVVVRADPAAPMGDAMAAHDASVFVTSPVPGEWFVLAEPEARDRVLDRLGALAAREERLVSVVDLTHGRALVRLTGARAADVLAKESALDLGDRGCPDGTALRTAVAGLAVDVVRNALGGIPSYLLHCERSSGQYLFDAVLDAGREFGIDVDGFRPPEFGTTGRKP